MKKEDKRVTGSWKPYLTDAEARRIAQLEGHLELARKLIEPFNQERLVIIERASRRRIRELGRQRQTAA